MIFAATRETRCIDLLFNFGAISGWMVNSTPQQPLPPGMTRYSLYKRPGGSPGPVWTGAENLALTGFDPRTVQPVASRYTNYAVAAQNFYPYCLYLLTDMDTIRYARSASNSVEELSVLWQSVHRNSYFSHGGTFLFKLMVQSAQDYIQ